MVAGFVLERRLRLTSLDLHGKIGWFSAILNERRHMFEARDSSLTSLELSVLPEEDGRSGLADLPHFGNLRTFRVFKPEFGTEPLLVDLLRRNLHHQLDEFACVASSTSSAPFLAAVPELDAAPPPVIDNSNQAEERRGGDGLKDEAKEPMYCSGGPTVAAGRPALWLRGLEQPVLEALGMLGAAVARNFALPENEKSFIGRLGRVKLELTQVLPSASGRKSLKEFQAHAAFRLREERLGKDAKLGIHLDVEAKSKKKRFIEEELMLTFLCGGRCCVRME
jgi:hypothetical protein